MKQLLQRTLIVILLMAAATAPANAGDVLDGVVASVNRQPILRSDWEEGVRFEAFMRQKNLAQVNDADRSLALQHLIDRQLIKAQMGDEKQLAPSDDALQQDIEKLRAQLPQGDDDVTWKKLLAGYGLNDKVLREHLRNEVEVMNFVEVRLRPNVHVEAADVQAYYQDTLLPDLAKNGGQPVALESVAPRIRELLVQQHIDELLDAWLHNLRQQAKIQSTVAIPGINAPARNEAGVGAN